MINKKVNLNVYEVTWLIQYFIFPNQHSTYNSFEQDFIHQRWAIRS